MSNVLPLSDFIPLVRNAIPQFRAAALGGPRPDAQQEACILHPANLPLQIVAGPGSGKTTVLVLRALRLVFVEGILPERILLTTFTRKAADEIRTRLIEWGLALVAHAKQAASPALAAHVAKIDVNRFITGTLDSVCEDAIRAMRAASDPAPVLLEGFAANAIMHRRALTGRIYVGGKVVRSVEPYLAQLAATGEAPGNVGELVSVARPLFDRFAHDLVDMNKFAALKPYKAARGPIRTAYEEYVSVLSQTNRLDFALLEREFLTRLSTGRLKRFTDGISAVLVDEYQDTNLLQEQIYFHTVRNSSASFTVVGDDDQSLYRFRGATVELFRDFADRVASAIPPLRANRLDLTANYRSTPAIVSFFNSFVINDSSFLTARVHPPKPAIVSQLPPNGVGILGMFRPDVETLADDLAAFLDDVFRGSGRVHTSTAGTVTIRRSPQGGDFGDGVLLAHSVNEFASRFGQSAPRERLPGVLRRKLKARRIGTFNPRGEALRDVADIGQIVGAMLECLDPEGEIQQGMLLRGVIHQYLRQFRDAHKLYAQSNPPPTTSHGLRDFVKSWGKRRVQGTVTTAQWPREWPVLELCFTLLAWFPRLRDDPEGQVHLEAVTRAIAQAASFSPYRSLVLNGVGDHDRRSVESAIRDIFAPLANGDIDVDEEVLPSIPRDRFSMMTIHQAKGLEFPLVVVDVSSDFSRNHPKNRFRRFPEQPSNVTVLETDLASACSIGALRLKRTGLQRTFEDLIRLYYVAFSRPQSVLLLVGLDPCLQYRTKIKHVAHFWRSDGSWSWIGPYTTKKAPALANNIPLELI